MASEQEQFLKDLEVKKDDQFGEDLIVASGAAVEETEDGEQRLKNRREKRLMDKLQRERESNIALNARIEALAEARKVNDSTEADFLKLVEPIYGNKTPETAQATDLLKKALQGAHDSAYKRAKDETLQAITEERNSESKAVEEEEENLDNLLDEVEDSHDLDFSDENTRRGFLTLLERVSPKDRDGNIIEFADGDTVAELYQAQMNRSNNRAKELASRSMTQSGASQPSKVEQDANWRALKEAGIF